jgi:dihydrolipoamide dehydrogenase
VVVVSGTYDLVVLGGGPGGYVAAGYAARRGLSVACVERDAVGGVCLHRGCIPSKTFIRSAELLHLVGNTGAYGVNVSGEASFDMAAALANKGKVVDRLCKGVKSMLKSAGAEVIAGDGRLDADANVVVTADGTETTLESRHVIVATGSAPRSIPGVAIDGEQVITSDHALSLDQVPSSIVILGAGAIGMEFAYILSSFGTKVTVLELLPRPLPLEDEDSSKEIQRLYRNTFRIECGVRVTGAEVGPGGVRVTAEDAAGVATTHEAEKLLVAVGRGPLSAGLGLETCGVETERGYIRCDERMQTANPKVYAIGDVVGRLPLAHTASMEGRLAVDAILGEDPTPIDYRMVPRGTYCIPEVASVGWTEAQAREAGLGIIVGRLMFRAIGKAIASGEFEGFCKVIAEKAGGKLLGVHLVGPHATDLIAEAGLALAMGATVRDVSRTVHAHPTLAEILMEVCEQLEHEVEG